MSLRLQSNLISLQNLLKLSNLLNRLLLENKLLILIHIGLALKKLLHNYIILVLGYCLWTLVKNTFFIIVLTILGNNILLLQIRILSIPEIVLFNPPNIFNLGVVSNIAQYNLWFRSIIPIQNSLQSIFGCQFIF